MLLALEIWRSMFSGYARNLLVVPLSFWKRKETQPLPLTLVPQGFRCAFKMSGAKAVLKAKRYSNSQGNGKQKITRVSGVRVEFGLSCLKLIKRQGFTILSIILPYNSLLIRTFGFNWEFLAKILITYQGQNEGWFRTFRTLINVNKKISTRHQLCSDNIIWGLADRHFYNRVRVIGALCTMGK